MTNELADGIATFPNVPSLAIRILANMQKKLQELENLLVTGTTLPYRYRLPLCVSPSNSSLDYSSYFEPVVDPSFPVLERTADAEIETPDLSDCFEPVESGLHHQRMVQ